MTNIDYNDLLDENGRRIEWYDEDSPADIYVGCNFAYDDEFPADETSANDVPSLFDESLHDMVKRHAETLDNNLEYQQYRSVCVASYMTELADLCMEMNSCLSDSVMVSLVCRVYNLLYYVYEHDLLSVYDVLEKNYLGFVLSFGVFDHSWEVIL